MLDIYGRGWRGEDGRKSLLAPRRPFRRALEAPALDPQALRREEDKLQLFARYRFGICVENYRGNRGYISEKIIDGFRAGLVPVYLGEAKITEIVPAEAFVDARAFRSPEALLTFLRDCPEARWTAMRAAGRRWLASAEPQQFSCERFAERAVSVLREVCPA